MLFIEKIDARVPGMPGATQHGTLVPTRRIIEKLSPRAPNGEDVQPNFIERHLGIQTVALTKQTYDFLDGVMWQGSGRPFANLDKEYRFQARGGVVNRSLMALVGECMEHVLPKTASERASVRRHIHISVAPPTDMDRHMGQLRRQHGLPEHIPTEYVAMACPSLPTVLMNLQRLSVAQEMLCLVTGDQNMLPFAQQYAPLAPEDHMNIDRWLYVSAFGEAAAAALLRLCPTGTPSSRHSAWEVVSAGASEIPNVDRTEWRGNIAPDGAMDINVRKVIPTYKAAMQAQVPIALQAIADRNQLAGSPEERRRAAIERLHAYCFHESNYNLLSEMARDHEIPDELVPRFCNRTGSLVGMSVFLTLSEALRTWEEKRAAGQRPQNVVAASIVGQAGINVACGHIVLQASSAFDEPLASDSSAAYSPQVDSVPLSHRHVRDILEPLAKHGDMGAFLRDRVCPSVSWQIMGHANSLCGSYSATEILAHWNQLLDRLQSKEYRLNIDNVLLDPEKRMASVEMHGDAALGDGSGRYRQSYCWILSFDAAGKVSAVRAYLDTAMAGATLLEDSRAAATL